MKNTPNKPNKKDYVLVSYNLLVRRDDMPEVVNTIGFSSYGEEYSFGCDVKEVPLGLWRKFLKSR